MACKVGSLWESRSSLILRREAVQPRKGEERRVWDEQLGNCQQKHWEKVLAGTSVVSTRILHWGPRVGVPGLCSLQPWGRSPASPPTPALPLRVFGWEKEQSWKGRAFMGPRQAGEPIASSSPSSHLIHPWGLLQVPPPSLFPRARPPTWMSLLPPALGKLGTLAAGTGGGSCPSPAGHPRALGGAGAPVGSGLWPPKWGTSERSRSGRPLHPVLLSPSCSGTYGCWVIPDTWGRGAKEPVGSAPNPEVPPPPELQPVTARIGPPPRGGGCCPSLPPSAPYRGSGRCPSHARCPPLSVPEPCMPCRTRGPTGVTRAPLFGVWGCFFYLGVAGGWGGGRARTLAAGGQGRFGQCRPGTVLYVTSM